MAGGRPTKFTPELREKFISVLRDGAYIVEACAFVGIDYTTFRNWMTKGEKAKTGEFFQFFNAVREAEAIGEIEAIHAWRQHIHTDWRAARDYLRYRHGSRWSPVQNIELTGSQKKPVRVRFNIERTTGADTND